MLDLCSMRGIRVLFKGFEKGIDSEMVVLMGGMGLL